MKNKLIIIMLVFLPMLAFTQTPPVVPVAPADQTVTATPAPAPAPAPEVKKEVLPPVMVTEASSPPEFFGKFLDAVSSAPFIGPIATKIIKYAGAAATILTLLLTFLLGVIKVLLPLFDLVNLAAASDFLLKVQNSKIMYYLKFFSLYNAKKKDDGTVSKIS